MLELGTDVTLGHWRRRSDPDSNADVWIGPCDYVATQIAQ